MKRLLIVFALAFLLSGCQALRPEPFQYYDHPVSDGTVEWEQSEPHRHLRGRYALGELLPRTYRHYPGGMKQAVRDARQAQTRARRRYGQPYVAVGRIDTSLVQPEPIIFDREIYLSDDQFGEYHPGAERVFVRFVEDRTLLRHILLHELTHAWQYRTTDQPDTALSFVRPPDQGFPGSTREGYYRNRIELNVRIAALKRHYVRRTGKPVATVEQARTVVAWMLRRAHHHPLPSDVGDLVMVLRYTPNHDPLFRYIVRLLPQLL